MRAMLPWTGVGPLKHEMERLFDRFFEPDNGESFAMGEWAPRLDLSETKDALITKVEVPAIDPKDMAVPGALARLSPPEVSNPSDNLKNLFEIPVIFYTLALYLFATSQVDFAYVAAGWVFAGFRVLQSAVHCTINIVMLRFYLYLVSTLAVWFIAARAAPGRPGTPVLWAWESCSIRVSWGRSRRRHPLHHRQGPAGRRRRAGLRQ